MHARKQQAQPSAYSGGQGLGVHVSGKSVHGFHDVLLGGLLAAASAEEELVTQLLWAFHSNCRNRVVALAAQIADARGVLLVGTGYATAGTDEPCLPHPRSANMELLRETADLCNLIMELTNWQIRLLSKSHLLPKLVADEKLRFLQYIDENTAGWWAGQRKHGAVLLGYVAKELGLTVT